MTSQNSAKISHFLAIDYGKSRVGLALADTETRLAFAYQTLDNDKEFFQKLAEIITGKNVKKVIIGLPSYINKETIEYEAERVGQALQDRIGVEVEYQNEMFTTKMAQSNLIAKGVKGIKKYDDQEAARIILQNWLDNA